AVIGYTDTRAESLLRRVGFDVATRTEESTAPAGRVLRTEPEPGQERGLPAFVTIIVSEGRPQDVLSPLPAGPDSLIRPDAMGRSDAVIRPDTLVRPASP